MSIKVPRFLRTMKRGHWLRLLASYAVAYVTLLALALLAIIGVAIGALLGADEQLQMEVTQATGGLDLVPSLFIVLITLPFQVAAVWLFGSFQFTLSVPESMSPLFPGEGMGASVSAPNLLFVVLAVMLAVWAGRIWFKRSGILPLTQVPRLARLIANLVLSLMMAGLTLLVTWVASFRQTFDLGDMAQAEGASAAEVEQMAEYLGVETSELGISLSANAAGFNLFLGAFIVYLVIGLVLSVNPRIFSKAAAKVAYFLPSLTTVPRVLATHGLIIVVPALIYVTVMFSIDGGAIGGLSFLFWAYTAAVISFVVLNFGAVSASGQAAGFGQSDAGSETIYLWTGDLAWWEVALAVLLGLVAIAVASLVWQLRRDTRESTLRNLLSWFTLPLVYALLGVVLVLFGNVRGEFQAFDAMTAYFSFGPAWWTFVILLLIGLVIEVLSRFAAPLLTQRLPASLRRRAGEIPAEK